MEELKITKERVLSAAGKCGTAKEVLKELFPEAFVVKEKWEDVTEKVTLGSWMTNEYGQSVGVWFEGDCPFLVCDNDQSKAGDKFMLKGGRIWVKRSE